MYILLTIEKSKNNSIYATLTALIAHFKAHTRKTLELFACSYSNEQLERSNRDIRWLPTAINHTVRGGRWLMFSSMRANFHPSLPFPLSSHIFTLSPPVFFESPFFGFLRRLPSRSHRQTAGYYRRVINLRPPIPSPSSLLPFRFSTSPAKHLVYSNNSRIASIFISEILHRHVTRAQNCRENISLNMKFRWEDDPFIKFILSCL